MPCLVKTVRILEVGMRHAQLTGLLVHERYKGIFGTRDVDGDILRAIVTRIDKHDAQELTKGRRVVDRIPCGLGIFTQVNVVNRTRRIKPVSRIEGHHGGHDLGNRGHRQFVVGVVFVEHVSDLIGHDSTLRLAQIRRPESFGTSFKRQHDKGHDKAPGHAQNNACDTGHALLPCLSGKHFFADAQTLDGIGDSRSD